MKEESLIIDRMVKRKSTVQEKKEAPRKSKPEKIKLNLAEMQDAVVERKLVVELGGKVYFERKLDGRAPAVHVGFVKSILGDGTVEVWDETREQLFCFNLNQEIPKIKRA